jgi:hypothetical protein
MFRALRPGLLALAALVAAGCSDSEPTGLKESLNAKEQQQLKELGQQRQQEWGNTKAGNKK